MIATAPTIPAAIAELPRWVVWKYDVIGNGRTTKVPYQAAHPEARASVADPSTWASFADAQRAAGAFEGVGVMLGDLDDGRRLAGVDLDDCLVDGVLTDQAAEIVEAMPSYWEVSPSGNGLKALCFGRKPEGSRCRVGQVECYDTGRWFAVTGQRFASDAVVPAQAALAEVCGMAGLLRPETVAVYTPPPVSQHSDATKARASAYLAAMPAAVEGSGGHGALYSAATALVHGFDLSRADALAMLWAEFNPRCSPPWDSSYSAQRREFERKVDQAMTQKHDRPRGWLLNEQDRTAPGASVDVAALIANADKGKANIRPGSIAALIDQHPELSIPIIDGVLRAGETGNIIAASKVGKSWLMYNLLICLATGRAWLDTFRCESGRVLLIDNELHPQTIANRLPKVAGAMGVTMGQLADVIDVLPLRGKGITLDQLADYIEQIEPGTYTAIVLDAWYRFIPKGLSENSNADVMSLYNLLDQYAASTGSAIIAVHHASKGAQGDKAVTDVGSGAGAQSRAADAHVVLRPHEDDGCVVLEAAVRSFAPIKPVGLRWEFPTWKRAADLNTHALKDRKTRTEQRQDQKRADGVAAVVEALKSGPATPRKMRELTGFSRGRLDGLLDKMVADGIVTYEDVTIRGNATKEYSNAE